MNRTQHRVVTYMPRQVDVLPGLKAWDSYRSLSAASAGSCFAANCRNGFRSYVGSTDV